MSESSSPGTPGESGPRGISGMRLVVGAAAFVIVVAGMRAAGAIIVPFLLAIFISVLLGPIFGFMVRRRVPALVAVLAIIVGLVVVGAGLSSLLGSSLDQFSRNLDHYRARLNQETQGIVTWVEEHAPKAWWDREKEAHESPAADAGTSAGADLDDAPTGDAGATAPDALAGSPAGDDPTLPVTGPTGEPPRVTAADKPGSGTRPAKNPTQELISRYLNPGTVMTYVATGLSSLRSMLTNAFLIILTVAFILLEAAEMPAKLRAVVRNDAALASASGIVDDIRRYMGVKTLVSLATGVFIWIWLAILGVDFAFLWGTLAFLLNYVPNIGSLIAAVPAVFLAWIQLGLGSAALAAAGFVTVNAVFGSIVETRVMGTGFGLSTLVVFLSLVFWGWVFGPVGMLLSVPLTMVAKIALSSAEDTRWIAILLGNGPPKPPPAAAASSGKPADQ